MGTFGALMGSLIAGLAYNFSGRNYAVTFSLSAVPALGALLLVTTVSSTLIFVTFCTHSSPSAVLKQQQERPAVLDRLFSHCACLAVLMHSFR